MDAPHVHVCAWALAQSDQYSNLLEGADCIGGQLCGDKECLFSGVTKSGRVWRKVPESDAWSVCTQHKMTSLFMNKITSFVGSPCPDPLLKCESSLRLWKSNTFCTPILIYKVWVALHWKCTVKFNLKVNEQTSKQIYACRIKVRFLKWVFSLLKVTDDGACHFVKGKWTVMHKPSKITNPWYAAVCVEFWQYIYM